MKLFSSIGIILFNLEVLHTLRIQKSLTKTNYNIVNVNFHYKVNTNKYYNFMFKDTGGYFTSLFLLYPQVG